MLVIRPSPLAVAKATKRLRLEVPRDILPHLLIVPSFRKPRQRERVFFCYLYPQLLVEN
jgi:hypothetical protein